MQWMGRAVLSSVGRLRATRSSVSAAAPEVQQSALPPPRRPSPPLTLAALDPRRPPDGSAPSVRGQLAQLWKLTRSGREI